MPDSPVAPPGSLEWDECQLDVIVRAPEDRLVVDAGPGTGKTAVACARVSQLIDHGRLEPSNIWLISFTRTAVREIRDRIAAYLKNPVAAYAVRIATLDSHAWAIHSGFSERASILDSYDKNIEKVLELVREDENVNEYLEGVEHLVVDEAQDIVGLRADLVVELIGKLPKSCGVTVFADEAQAIYGFSDDKDIAVEKSNSPPFLTRILSNEAGLFQKCQLSIIHRTGSRELLQIFSQTRHSVLVASGEDDDKLRRICHEVTKLAHGEAPPVNELESPDQGEKFILYRRRCDVLLASSFLMEREISHRVRMSGLPVCLAPWIGAALSLHTAPSLSRVGFMILWADKVHDTAFATCKPSEAWEVLVRIAGRSEDFLDMRLLRQRLGRRQPPAELCHPEHGLSGPIVGTIHASKGREADVVHLMLPPVSASATGIGQDEEARVIFVGATRARSRLLTGSGYRQFAGRLDSGRVYHLHQKSGRAQFEVGRENDLSAQGLAGRDIFASPDDVRNAQNRIGRLLNRTVPLIAIIDRNAGFVYRLKEPDHDLCLAVLSPDVVNRDLFVIAKFLQNKLGGPKRRPPDVICHLFGRGARTVVLQPDAPGTETLHEPWRSSGILLAPLVLGYSTAPFPIRRRRNAR